MLDTSVLINLRACTQGGRVLASLPNNILVPQIVAGELEHESSVRNGDISFLHEVAERGIVEITELTDEEYDIFYNLTSLSPSLDDGEAATIAVAMSRNNLPVIDERKGRSRASCLMNGREPIWSLDLFRHPFFIDSLGDQAVEVLYLALRDGRMRIPSASADMVIALLGIERSIDCTSLPGYRERFSVSERRPDVNEARLSIRRDD
ncbi:DNA-binding protein [Azospirillum oryzae]|uniref:DNA-binding protein n=1 Tax=Azospirillum oryzae TaxID=286727 RepID=UPI001FCDCEAD|nr:DNA-binding protein [Azospirillum oryzae]